ncbi:MAG: hypothetical protein HZA50_06290 [Planctomycetes bacterium]|nr:hypothetical protein [Planctomycetota bacterium]
MVRTLKILLPESPTKIAVSEVAGQPAAKAPDRAPPKPHPVPGVTGGSPESDPAVVQLRQQLDQERNAMAQARQAVVKAAESLVGLRDQILKDAEQQLVDLSLQIARKVLMQDIQAGNYQIDPIIKEALGQIDVRDKVVVRLNPEDLARCQMAQDKAGAGNLEFVGDPAIQPAECVLDTPEGQIRSNVDIHLDGIGQALKAGE